MCRVCNWEEFLKELEVAIDCGRFGWAYRTLDRMYRRVHQSEHCTMGQARTLRRIMQARKRA